MVNFGKPCNLSNLAYCVVIQGKEAEKWSLACRVHILAILAVPTRTRDSLQTRRVGPPWVAAI